MKIKKSGEGITLSLNTKFYKKQAIDSGVSEFKKVCEVTKGKNAGYHLVSFKGLAAPDLNDVALEFANYILFLMKSQKVK